MQLQPLPFQSAFFEDLHVHPAQCSVHYHPSGRNPKLFPMTPHVPQYPPHKVSNTSLQTKSICYLTVSLELCKALHKIYKNIYEAQILYMEGATTNWYITYSFTYFHSILLEIDLIPASTCGKKKAQNDNKGLEGTTRPAKRSLLQLHTRTQGILEEMHFFFLQKHLTVLLQVL